MNKYEIDNIMINKIELYCCINKKRLIEILEQKYFDKDIFLSIKFYNDFKQNFKCSYNKFIIFLEENEINTAEDLTKLFYYEIEWY